MTNRPLFLRAIYSLGAIQLASVLLAWTGVQGLMMVDSVVLFLADWTAFLLMARRHARIAPLQGSPLSQILGLILLTLSVVRLFTVGEADSIAIILGSYLGLGGAYLMFTRLRDLRDCWPELLVASIVLLRVGAIAGRIDAWLHVTPFTVEIGSWFLYLLGNETLVQNQTIATSMGAVILEWPCTGLLTGGGLIAIATALAFSKPWSRPAKAWIFLSGVALAFLAGCMRVVVMSYVVSDIHKFKFWHGTPGFFIFAVITYGLFALSVFLAPKLLPCIDSTVEPSNAKTARVSRMSVGLTTVMVGVAIFAWVRLPWAITRHADFPYPDLSTTLQASPATLKANPDPNAEESWGRTAIYQLPQGSLTLTYRPTGDLVSIRNIFLKLSDNTPTDWDYVATPEGPIAWRLENGSLEIATLIHPGGHLTVTDEEYIMAIHRKTLTLPNFVHWFMGQGKLRDGRAVLIHLSVPEGDANRVQSFVPIVLRVANLTNEKF
jgi:hypothetical protein